MAPLKSDQTKPASWRIACPEFACSALPGKPCTRLAEYSFGRVTMLIGHAKRRALELKTRSKT